jgi:16S rRNA (guanine527-N7)-methyltransferase
MSKDFFKYFSHTFSLSSTQERQFEHYSTMLREENEKYNLTAVTDPVDIIFEHFFDSLILSRATDLSLERGLCDIGSGAGFPGIALKILYPELPLILIEVTKKKIAFLGTICKTLQLENVTFYSNDWLTFLRKSQFDVTLFTARASLQPRELLRMFQPSSFYRHARLVYYASEKWVPLQEEVKFIENRFEYTVREKQRVLIFFRAPKAG